MFYIFEEVYNPELLRPLNRSKEVQLPLYEMNKNLNYSSEVCKKNNAVLRHYKNHSLP